MSKAASFKWAWDHDEPAPDKLMSRDRLAGLLRHWRRSPGHSLRTQKRTPQERVYTATNRDGLRVTAVAASLLA